MQERHYCCKMLKILLSAICNFDLNPKINNHLNLIDFTCSQRPYEIEHREHSVARAGRSVCSNRHLEAKVEPSGPFPVWPPVSGHQLPVDLIELTVGHPKLEHQHLAR